MLRKLLSKNAYIRYYLHILLSYFRTYKLKKQFEFRKGKKSINTATKKLLIAGSVASNPDTFMETIMASGFELYDYEIYFLQCDKTLDACFACKKYLFDNEYLEKKLSINIPDSFCNSCLYKSNIYIKQNNFKLLKYSEFLETHDIFEVENIIEKLNTVEQIKSFQYNGYEIGNHAYSACVRFYANTEIQNELYGFDILKKYFISALKTHFICQNLDKKHKFEVVIVNHGIYVPQGIIADFFNSLNSKVLCWSTGYRNKTFIMSLGRSYHYDFVDDIDFERKINNYDSQIIIDYLNSRKTGSQDWVVFHEKRSSQQNAFKNIIDNSKINICLYTNVMWDANLHFRNSIFSDMKEWVLDTINYLSRNDNINIIIRIHPGEIKGFIKSRILFEKILRENLSSKILQQIKIISSDNDLNSYDLANIVDYNILFGSKLAIELSALGYTILVAGDSWTRNKGITIDPINKKEYFVYLDQMINNDFNKNNIDRNKALKFAYYVFFTRSIKFNFITKINTDPPFKIIEKDFYTRNTFKQLYNYVKEN
jgi:hypothetical protein